MPGHVALKSLYCPFCTDTLFQRKEGSKGSVERRSKSGIPTYRYTIVDTRAKCPKAILKSAARPQQPHYSHYSISQGTFGNTVEHVAYRKNKAAMPATPAMGRPVILGASPED
jgi:hypothetical protein